MTPAFKTLRQLHDRALLSDSFDYSSNWVGPTTTLTGNYVPQFNTDFTQGGGLAAKAHKDGYNVLYGDNHIRWFDDSSRQISRFNRWNDATAHKFYPPGSTTPTVVPALLGVDDLTIASPTSQQVWNLFDRAEKIDTTDDVTALP
jgi:hypothetical protein